MSMVKVGNVAVLRKRPDNYIRDKKISNLEILNTVQREPYKYK